MSSPTSNWTPKKRSRIVILRENLSYADIARQVGGSVTLSGVRMLWLGYEDTKSVINKAKLSRKKCASTSSDDRKIKRICLKDRRISSDAVRCEMKAIGISFSSRTIRRRLAGSGLKGRILRKKTIFKSSATQEMSSVGKRIH